MKNALYFGVGEKYEDGTYDYYTHIGFETKKELSVCDRASIVASCKEDFAKFFAVSPERIQVISRDEWLLCSENQLEEQESESEEVDDSE